MSSAPPDKPNEPEPLEELVCFCHGVPKREIEQAIRDGAVTLADIKLKTKASTGCGGCTCVVEEILTKQLASKS